MVFYVSIRTPRVGRDLVKRRDDANGLPVSIRTPRVGGDGLKAKFNMNEMAFQSARPAWGATWSCTRRPQGMACFNPHAPRGARHYRTVYDPGQSLAHVSIRTPRVGRDPVIFGYHDAENGRLFQSARPAWGATRSLDLRETVTR